MYNDLFICLVPPDWRPWAVAVLTLAAIVVIHIYARSEFRGRPTLAITEQITWTMVAMLLVAPGMYLSFTICDRLFQ